MQRETGAVGDRFNWLGESTLDVITKSVAVKGSVVNTDPFEKGRRAILNTGHTVAHALERETGYALLHGEAVAIGLVIEAELGEAAGITARGTADALRSALGSAGLPTRIPTGLDHGHLVDAMRLDKKSRAGGLAFALLKEIGKPAGSEVEGWSAILEERLVREVLQSSVAD
jgi:3-dehydroquinate synthetase